MNKATFLASIALALSVAVPASAAQDDLFKTWKTHKGGTVTFAPCGDQVCGTISGLDPERTGPPPLDEHNPDPALRARPLLGLQIFEGFDFAGDDKWKGGKIYNTDNGKIYKSKLRLLEDGRLKMSGCVLFLCPTHIWAPASEETSIGATTE